MKLMKAKKKKDWTENDENRWLACLEFADSMSDMLRIYISPKKTEKLGKKLYAFLEEEANRYEGFKKMHPGGVSDLQAEVNESPVPPASPN